MSNKDHEKERLEHNDTGGHLGGTKFGQSPGTAGPNPARPDDEGNKDKKGKNDE